MTDSLMIEFNKIHITFKYLFYQEALLHINPKLLQMASFMHKHSLILQHLNQWHLNGYNQESMKKHQIIFNTQNTLAFVKLIFVGYLQTEESVRDDYRSNG